jgi:hypothetical protein
MMRSTFAVTLLLLMTSAPLAHAGEEVRSCEYKVKARGTSGLATVTLTDGVVSKVDVSVFYAGLRGRPGYTCTVNSSRAEKDDSWSDEAGATVITNGTPFNPTVPDRVRVTVGKYVSIDLAEAQSLGRCGAGAELPKAIVIPASKGACRVFLDNP